MDIGQANIARPDPIDRNASVVSVNTGLLTLSPHADTIQSSYTVPSGKKAIILSVVVWVRRVTAPTASGDVTVNITFSGLGPIAYFHDQLPNVRDSYSLTQYGQISMDTSQAVEVHTADASTGGTVEYLASLYILEYDV